MIKELARLVLRRAEASRAHDRSPVCFDPRAPKNVRHDASRGRRADARKIFVAAPFESHAEPDRGS
jgi:hypothetical protein